MEYRRHSYVLDQLSDGDRKKYECIVEEKASMDACCASLQFLSQCLESYYGKSEKVMTLFQEKIQEKDLTNLYTAFVNKDTDTLEEELSQILFETISSMDENESYYHGIVAGLLSPMKGYRTKSNREAGKGRSDLFIKLNVFDIFVR